MNTAIISPTGGSIGIGFAVPSNSAVQVVDQLKQFGETRRGWLGVHVQNVTGEIAESLGLKEPTGALVANVSPDSPAAAAGIQPSDVILKFDGQPIETMRSLPRAVAATTDRQVRRGRAVCARARPCDLNVTVGRLPEERGGRRRDARASSDAEGEAEPEHEDLLGLSIAPLTDELREPVTASARRSKGWSSPRSIRTARRRRRT